MSFLISSATFLDVNASFTNASCISSCSFSMTSRNSGNAYLFKRKQNKEKYLEMKTEKYGESKVDSKRKN